MTGLVLVDVVPDPDPARTRAGLERSLGASVARSALVNEILERAPRLRAAARRAKVPTLLVRAEGSFGVRAEDVQRLRAWMPQLREVVVEDCGHLIARERPHELARALLEFFSAIHPPRMANVQSPTRD